MLFVVRFNAREVYEWLEIVIFILNNSLRFIHQIILRKNNNNNGLATTKIHISKTISQHFSQKTKNKTKNDFLYETTNLEY
jgi:hypothetical protein